MANALFIGWGRATRAREQGALQVTSEVLEYFKALQQQNEIEAFETVSLEPHGGGLYGFLLVRGDPEHLSHIRTSEEFQRLILRANLVVEDIGVVTAFVDDEQTRRFAIFQQQVSELAG